MFLCSFEGEVDEVMASTDPPLPPPKCWGLSLSNKRVLLSTAGAVVMETLFVVKRGAARGEARVSPATAGVIIMVVESDGGLRDMEGEEEDGEEEEGEEERG